MINSQSLVKETRMGIFLWCLLSCAILFPKKDIGSLSVGVEDVVACLLFPWIIALIFEGRLKSLAGGYGYIRLWMATIVIGVVFGLINSYTLLGEMIIPTEMWQYVKRAVFFFASAWLIASGMVKFRTALKIFFMVVFILNIIGIMQIWSPIAGPLAALYARNERLLENLSEKLDRIDSIRNYSVTGHPNSWGGLASFMGALAFGIAMLNTSAQWSRKDIIKARVTAAILVGLCFTSVVLSGSRAALFAFSGMMVFLMVFNLFGHNITKRTETFIWLLIFSFTCMCGLYIFFPERITFIQYRNEKLLEAYYIGINRFQQTEITLSLMEGPFSWIFGIGNAAQRRYGISFGVEVEPVYLYGNYGILGLVLRYLIVWKVFRDAYRLFNESHHGNRALAQGVGLGAMLGIVSYIIFSSGYFFFQETVAGTFPWVYFGLVIGLSSRIPPIPDRHRVILAS